MKTAEEKLAFLMTDQERRAEQAERAATLSDLDEGDQFLTGFLTMLGADALRGEPERIEAMRAMLAIMVHDIRAGERLRMKRGS